MSDLPISPQMESIGVKVTGIDPDDAISTDANGGLPTLLDKHFALRFLARSITQATYERIAPMFGLDDLPARDRHLTKDRP